jgi:nitrogen fixation protein FixH
MLELYNDKLNGKTKELSQFLRNKAEDILYANKKFRANTNVLEKDIEKAETPKEFRKGKFKIYLRDDGNLNVMFLLNKEQTGWLVDINNVDDIFAYLGKANKYPAEVASNVDKTKLVDEGDVELGIQRDGYHEYKLDGNKFDTRLHFRVIEVDNKEMWLTWSGYKQEMNEMDSDEGIWDLSKDRYKKLTIPKKD